MIIFDTLLNTFEVYIIFEGAGGCIKNWLQSKTKPPLQSLTKLSFSKSVVRTVLIFFSKFCKKKNIAIIYKLLHVFDDMSFFKEQMSSNALLQAIK